jgi:protein ImuB
MSANNGGSRDEAGPLVFTVRQRGAFRLQALDEAALRMGLEPGMALADARARLPDLVALPHDPDGEAALMADLATLAERYTPAIAIDPPEGLVLDIAGCTHFFASEAALARDAVDRMRAQGMRVRAACADTPEAALALARFADDDAIMATSAAPAPLPLAGGARGGDREEGRGRSSPSAQRDAPGETAAIARLPLIALRLDPDRLLALRRAGFATLGELAALPRGPLAARFGKGLVDALDRLLGRADSRIVPRLARPPVEAVRRFAEPVAHVGTVMAVLGALLEEVAAMLDARHEGGRRFVLRLDRSDGAVRDLMVETGAPVRAPAAVLRLFAERIEALADPLDPGFGFDALHLAVPRTEPLSPVQPGLDGERDHDGDLAALLDRLGARAGAQRFCRLRPQGSHLPERAARLVPTADAAPTSWPAPAPGEPPLRPLTLFDPPERVMVIAAVPDGPPRSFRWRGAVHRIVAQEGPERIAPEWWRRRDGHAADPGLSRDYYRVEDEAGARFWLFRHGLYGRETDAPDWYVHGLFA